MSRRLRLKHNGETSHLKYDAGTPETHLGGSLKEAAWTDKNMSRSLLKNGDPMKYGGRIGEKDPGNTLQGRQEEQRRDLLKNVSRSLETSCEGTRQNDAGMTS